MAAKKTPVRVQYAPILINAVTSEEADFMARAARKIGVSRVHLIREAALQSAEDVLGTRRPKR